jgi:hypothetical protein
MADGFGDEKTKLALHGIAAEFDELANLAPEDIVEIISTWNANRRSDFVDSLINAPFSQKTKKSK